LPQTGQGEGSFLYLVASSPLTSSSSLFMCLGPGQRHGEKVRPKEELNAR
jgi:hypothetical protein